MLNKAFNRPFRDLDASIWARHLRFFSPQSQKIAPKHRDRPCLQPLPIFKYRFLIQASCLLQCSIEPTHSNIDLLPWSFAMHQFQPLYWPSNLPLLRPPIQFPAIEMTLSMHNIFKCQNQGLWLEAWEFDEWYKGLTCLFQPYCEQAFCDMLNGWSINVDMGEWKRRMLEQDSISKPGTVFKDNIL